MIKLTFLIALLVILYYTYKAYRDYKSENDAIQKAQDNLSKEIIKGRVLDVEADINEQKQTNKQKQTSNLSNE